MPTWGEILQELSLSAVHQGTPDFDGIRRKYLSLLAAYTRRDTVIYYTDWLAGSSPASSITLEDMQALMEVMKGLSGPDLDIILHSPGGSAEAVASMVRYIRQKFTGVVRVFVPLAAMSAGTMLALSANRIVMGKHSQLGPIDPQIFTPQQSRYQPARAIIEQFERAKTECKVDPSVLSAWLPILQQYGPGLISECENAEQLSKGLVQEWLENYMFAGHLNAASLAESAADYFGDYKTHKSHALGIDRSAARAVSIVVDDLEMDQHLQDLVLSVHHATMHTLGIAAVKIVENQNGAAFVKISQQVAVPQFSRA